MKKTGIIGLGTITKQYISGLARSEVLTPTAVCDSRPDAVSRGCFPDYPFYEDFRDMIREEKLEYVIISTPPESHFEIAFWALTHGVNVIVEKPVTVNMEQYEQLLELAERHNRILEVMYHWQGGTELVEFNRRFDKGGITEIYAEVQDPYSADGVTVDEQKVKLLGTWIDSGVNILSMIKTWLPMEHWELEAAEVVRCPRSALPICVDLKLRIDGIKTRIVVDWRNQTNRKSSWVIWNGEKIVIDHSGQRILQGDSEIPCGRMERLAQHYDTYFSQYREDVDTESSVRIHRVLFGVNDQL